MKTEAKEAKRQLSAIETAAEAVQTAQDALDKLKAETAGITGELEAMRAKRAEIVREQARTGEDMTATIDEPDTAIKGHERRLEGLAVLISEAEETVKQAEDALEWADGEERAKMRAFVAEHLQVELDALVAGIPERLKRIAGMYADLAFELGALRVDTLKSQKMPGGEKLLDLSYRFYGTLQPLIDGIIAIRPFPAAHGLIIDGLIRPVGQLNGTRAGMVTPVEEIIAEIRRSDVERLEKLYRDTK